MEQKDRQTERNPQRLGKLLLMQIAEIKELNAAINPQTAAGKNKNLFGRRSA